MVGFILKIPSDARASRAGHVTKYERGWERIVPKHSGILSEVASNEDVNDVRKKKQSTTYFK